MLGVGAARHGRCSAVGAGNVAEKTAATTTFTKWSPGESEGEEREQRRFFVREAGEGESVAPVSMPYLHCLARFGILLADLCVGWFLLVKPALGWV